MKTPTIALAVALAGCVPIQTAMQNALNVVQIATPYDDTAFAGYAATGTAIVTGQAFERTNGGDVKYAAGYTIRLLPSTPYSNEYFVQIAAGKNIAGEGSFASGRFSADAVSVSAMHSHELTTTADGSGHFGVQERPAWILPCLRSHRMARGRRHDWWSRLRGRDS